MLDLTLPYRDPAKPELDEIAQEINGKDLTPASGSRPSPTSRTTARTTAGDWIYTGSLSRRAATWPSAATACRTRRGNDPTGMGFYPELGVVAGRSTGACSTTAPRPTRRAGRGTRSGRASAGTPAPAWVGDVPDYPPDADPRDPTSPLPFIMTGEGTGRLFSNGLADGPFPEHYEPIESPVDNPLHPEVSATPAAFLYDEAAGRPNRFGTVDEFPYVATSYRLTEHEHYVTQHVEQLVQLQPEAFVEMPAELAREKGIETGDLVRVSSKRGKLEVRAVVTKRLGALTDRRQEGLPDRHPDPLGLRRHQDRPALARQRAHAVRRRRQRRARPSSRRSS